jgi:hypothetical protein
MSSSQDTVRPEQQGSHSGQWGLAGLLLGFLVLILFPIGVGTILGLLIGAWNIDEVELRHVEFAVLGGRVVVYGLAGLGVLALLCGVLGLIRAFGRGQPFGLAFAGTATGLLATIAGVVLVIAGHYVIEDTHRLRSEHPRFRKADAALVQQVKQLVDQNPTLKPDWDRAMKDGSLTEAEAERILLREGRRVIGP